VRQRNHPPTWGGQSSSQGLRSSHLEFLLRVKLLLAPPVLGTRASAPLAGIGSSVESKDGS